MSHFRRFQMPTILEEIIARKKKEVALLHTRLEKDTNHPINKLLKQKRMLHERKFEKALQTECLSVIAEIKRKSPSAGVIGEIGKPEELAKKYAAGGANCISCLTDFVSFGGSIEDLRAVCSAVDIPVLQKDFIVDKLQMAEAKEAGASAVLLIVASLLDDTGDFLEEAERLGLCALVEVHDKFELEIAIKYNARIIGVNARNLHTFKTDLSTCEKVLSHGFPQFVIKVAESGIHSWKDAHRMRRAGFDAILVGETLVKSKDPASILNTFKIPPRPLIEVCGVTDKETCYEILKLGIDIVGVLFEKKSPSYCTIETAKLVVEGAGSNEVWGIFTSHKTEEILRTVKQTGIRGVQLYHNTARACLRELKMALPYGVRVIYVIQCDAIANGKYQTDEIQMDLKFLCRDTGDFILFDGIEYVGGLEVPFDWQVFQPLCNCPVFLAGGVNAKNIGTFLQRFGIFGVNLSSHEDNEELVGSRKKLFAKIKEFIEAINKTCPLAD